MSFLWKGEWWTYRWSFSAIVTPKMSWTNQQKIFSLEIYFATKSYQSVQIQFWKCFHCRKFPSKSTIVHWVRKFREHGTVVNLCSKATGGPYSGRKKSARTEENITAARDSVICSPRNGPRTHQILTPQIFICGVSSKTMYTREIHKQLRNWKLPSQQK